MTGAIAILAAIGAQAAPADIPPSECVTPADISREEDVAAADLNPWRDAAGAGLLLKDVPTGERGLFLRLLIDPETGDIVGAPPPAAPDCGQE